MKYLGKLALIAIAIAVGVATYLQYPSSTPLPLTHAQPVADERESSTASNVSNFVTETLLPSAKPLTPGELFEAARTRIGNGHDPMIVIGYGEFTDAEIAAYNKLHIIPFNPVIDEECTVVPSFSHPNDERFDGKKCVPTRANPKHPYYDLDIDALSALAETDAAAALIMGRKAIPEQEAMLWSLRAAALSGKSGPITALANMRYDSEKVADWVDGKYQTLPAFDMMVNRIALDTIAGKMGDPRAHPERWKTALSDLANDEQREHYLKQADERTKELLLTMIEIQREIGSVQIAGQS